MPHTVFTTRDIVEVKLEELPQFFKEKWKEMWPEPSTPYIRVVHGDQEAVLHPDLVQFIIRAGGPTERLPELIEEIKGSIGAHTGKDPEIPYLAAKIVRALVLAGNRGMAEKLADMYLGEEGRIEVDHGEMRDLISRNPLKVLRAVALHGEDAEIWLRRAVEKGSIRKNKGIEVVRVRLGDLDHDKVRKLLSLFSL